MKTYTLGFGDLISPVFSFRTVFVGELATEIRFPLYFHSELFADESTRISSTSLER